MGRSILLLRTGRALQRENKIIEEENIVIDIHEEPSEIGVAEKPVAFDEILTVLEIPGAATGKTTDTFSEIENHLSNNAKTDMRAIAGGQKATATGGTQSNCTVML